MLKKLFGIAPKLESDGSYSPSKMALKMSVSAKTDFEQIRLGLQTLSPDV